MMINISSAPISINQQITETIFLITLDLPLKAKPGQFFLLKLPFKDPLLGRPLSIFDCGRKAQFLYQIKGLGTRLLSQMTPGQTLDLIGPLGKGWKLPEKGQKVALVGGGIGLATLKMLAQEIHGKGIIQDIYLGFTASPYLTKLFSPLTNNLIISSETDNSYLKGKITEHLKITNYDIIYACGPRPMLKALWLKLQKEKTQSSIPEYQVSLEEKMACGVGSCYGCVVKIAGSFYRICHEGPVFNGREVNWDENG